MATLFGRVDALDENNESWEHYTERLGHYFDANGIADESGDDNALSVEIERTYTGEVVPVVGECELEVEYNVFKGNVSAGVISGEGPCL